MKKIIEITISSIAIFFLAFILVKGVEKQEQVQCQNHLENLTSNAMYYITQQELDMCLHHGVMIEDDYKNINCVYYYSPDNN